MVFAFYVCADAVYTDVTSWMYWTVVHAIYGIIIGLWIKRGVRQQEMMCSKGFTPHHLRVNNYLSTGKLLIHA